MALTGSSTLRLAGLTIRKRWRTRFRAFPGSWNMVCLSVSRRRPFWPDRTASRSSNGRDILSENGVMKMSIIQAIKRTSRLAAVAVALVAFGPAAHSQQPSAAAMSTAKEIVTVTGATTLFNPLIAGVVEQAKLLYLQQNPGLAKDLNEITEKMRNDLQPRFAELTNEIAKEYVTRFTEPESKTILAFYASPAGKKLLDQQPNVVDASMKFAQEWANKLSDEVVAKMRDELKKRGHAL